MAHRKDSTLSLGSPLRKAKGSWGIHKLMWQHVLRTLFMARELLNPIQMLIPSNPHKLQERVILLPSHRAGSAGSWVHKASMWTWSGSSSSSPLHPSLLQISETGSLKSCFFLLSGLVTPPHPARLPFKGPASCHMLSWQSMLLFRDQSGARLLLRLSSPFASVRGWDSTGPCIYLPSVKGWLVRAIPFSVFSPSPWQLLSAHF